LGLKSFCIVSRADFSILNGDVSGDSGFSVEFKLGGGV